MKKKLIICAIDVLISAITSLLTTYLIVVPDPLTAFLIIFSITTICNFSIFSISGSYDSVIRHLDEKSLLKMGLLALSVPIVVFIALKPLYIFNPMAFFCAAFVNQFLVVTSRLIAKIFLHEIRLNRKRKVKVAIYGAGEAGIQTAVALKMGPEFHPIAFFDDSVQLQGKNIMGLPVLNPENITSYLSSRECRHLLIAIPSAPQSVRQKIIQKLDGSGLILKTLPGLAELVDGKVRIENIRDVGIEDLLGRDLVPPQDHLMSSQVKGKVVLVTGAGGSIGSELCRQVSLIGPEKLILLDNSEFSLYKIEQELIKIRPHMKIVPTLGSVCDASLLNHIFSEHKIQTLYHAAAYKHVPLVEQNEMIGVINNVVGTQVCAEIAGQHNVETFILVSTDKAVRPTNVMGSTKRISEMILQALSAEKKYKTKYCMVRFGNVLGSSGSVIPVFQEQIKHGGPLTVTHPDITRYFMTIPEASQLVIQAGALSKSGDVFVLDMGQPVKIVDLAKKVIQLSGFEVKDEQNPGGDIAIEFVGLRPGEKLYEELLICENAKWTDHPRIMRAEEEFLPKETLYQEIDSLIKCCLEFDRSKIRKQIQKVVPEFKIQ